MGWLMKSAHGVTNIRHTVKNISNQELTNDEIEALSYGVGHYVPPRKVDKLGIFTDLELLNWKLSQEVATNIEKAQECQAHLKKSAYKISRFRLPNDKLADRQRLVIKDLKNRGLLVFKYDKGNGTLVCSRQQYEDKMNHILEDSSKFEVSNSDIDWNDEESRKKLCNLLKEIISKGELPKDTIDLLPKGATIPRLYGLPKVHKPDCPFRPILSMVGSVYHKISEFIDKALIKPILHLFTDHSVRNTADFVQHIRNVDIHRGDELISYDVSSLFTNIPVQETIQLICDAWYRGDIEPPTLGTQPLSEDSLTKLLSQVTQMVRFTFGDKLLIQKDGLAMGSVLSGSFATVFMGAQEKRLFSSTPRPKSYRRFIDDIHVVIEQNDKENFSKALNSLHPSLKFTEDDGDHFLDVKMHVASGNIDTSVFRKQTFTGLYINYQSHCPKMYKVNLVRSLFQRARVICSPQYLDQECKLLENVLE